MEAQISAVSVGVVDGRPMPAPDAEADFSFTDLDASDSGRTEDGVMHRIVVREKVGAWGFAYSHLTDEELAYLKGLFAGKVSTIDEMCRGNIRLSGMISMVDNINRILDRVSLYLA